MFEHPIIGINSLLVRLLCDIHSDHTDEERADVVVAMSLPLRKEAAAAVDVRLWENTLEVIRSSSIHAL